MANIGILSEQVRNLIAAGEVVERPASVVKELVDNAIDAGATEITVSVVDGGLKEIAVTDNGSGMDEEDIKLCVERHATSKLVSAEDLSQIKTMGFRGEALPSIAAISKMLIESRPAKGDHISGNALRIEGGKVVSFEEKGLPVGTRVVVADIFYNVPARKKFARAPRTELGHVKDIAQKMALANPAVRFRLISDGGEILNAVSINDGRQRAAEVLGPEIIKDSRLCEADAGEIRVYGLVSDPSHAKEGSKGLYWFVNRRPVRDRMLNHAIGEAYRSLLPRGYSPFSVLFITVPPEFVDVNVHPAKSEVKFLKGNAVHDFVVTAVKRAIGTSSTESLSPWGEGRGEGENRKLYTPPHPSLLPKGEKEYRKYTQEQKSSKELHVPGKFSCLRLIGQLHNSYILCENSEGALVTIDQHAAHERIGYEKLKEGYEQLNTERQGLLIPEVVEVSSKGAGYLEEALEELNKIGWEIEHFGGDNFCVKAVPAILGNINVKHVITTIALELAEKGKIDSIDDRIDYLMKVSACHAQIRAGERLEDQEMRRLLREMDLYDWSDRCPHGRPAVFELGLNELSKRFNRT